MALNIEKIICGPLDVNAYVVYEENGRECIVIDPAEAEPVLAFLSARNMQCTHALFTHGHFDHIGGAYRLQKECGARICIHQADAQMLHSDEKSLAHLANMELPAVYADIEFEGGETILAANLKIEALHTPGHSLGSVTYKLSDSRVLFTGDTLFRLGIGRADFPGSNAKDLLHSIETKLFSLEGDYRVLPGHMRETTLEFEKQHNKFARPTNTNKKL